MKRYYIVCLVSYVVLFFIEYFFIKTFAPLFIDYLVPLWFYLVFLLLVNPIVIYVVINKRFSR